MDYKTYLNSSQHKPQMMYYQSSSSNPFYELRYNFTVYEQFFYDDLVATILPFTIYSYRNLELLPCFLLSYLKNENVTLKSTQKV